MAEDEREWENSNQEGSNVDRGEGVCYKIIWEVKLTEHHGDWLECKEE